MKRASKSIVFLIVALVLFAPRSYSGDIGKGGIAVILPAPTLAKLFKEVLPIKLGPNDDISGDIWIDSIANLRFDQNKVSCSMSLRGKDVKWPVQIQKSRVIMEVGDVNTTLSLEGAFRFEKASNRLYLTPRVVKDPEGLADGSPIRVLLTLLSGVEYPIEMQKLEPMMAKLSGQEFRLDLSVSDISSDRDSLFFTLEPKMVKTGA